MTIAVVFYKDGYWYFANTARKDTECFGSRRAMEDYAQAVGFRLLRASVGGAEYWGQCV